MEENKDLTALLERMEKSARQQVKYARLQCLFSIIAAVLCACALGAVLYLMPQVDGLARQAEAVLRDVQQVSSQLAQADWDSLVDNMEQVSRQMAQADLSGMVEDIGALVSTSQTGLNETLAKLNAIDFQKLNQAITDLAKIVEPLARMFGRL